MGSIAGHMEETTDTEITLGTGKMLGLFFGLVVLCAVFFGMGFSMGRNSVKETPELLPSPSQSTRPVTSRNSSQPASVQPPQAAAATPAPAPADNSGATNSSQPTAPPDQSSPQASASQPGAGYFVQVAAVSKQEDAEALVESLKGHQYQAIVANQPSDKLFHVQVGPFSDVKDAEAMRMKLVSDGYNPILKK